jgi:hypothetical protein
MDAKVRNRLERLEAFADLIKEHVSVLKKELEGSGVSTGSVRKGLLSEKEKAKILARRQKSRMRKASR